MAHVKLNPEMKNRGYRFAVLSVDKAVPQKGGIITIDVWHQLMSGVAVELTKEQVDALNERIPEFVKPAAKGEVKNSPPVSVPGLHVPKSSKPVKAKKE